MNQTDRILECYLPYCKIKKIDARLTIRRVRSVVRGNNEKNYSYIISIFDKSSAEHFCLPVSIFDSRMLQTLLSSRGDFPSRLVHERIHPHFSGEYIKFTICGVKYKRRVLELKSPKQYLKVIHKAIVGYNKFRTMHKLVKG